jgi:hypothetical protein
MRSIMSVFGQFQQEAAVVGRLLGPADKVERWRIDRLIPYAKCDTGNEDQRPASATLITEPAYSKG